MMNQFVLKSKLDNRANNFKAQEDYLNKISDFSGKYEVKNTESNTKLSDYGASFFDNKIRFLDLENSLFLANKFSF